MQAGHQAMAANQLIQTNWGLQALQSFRAPAGTLDKRMPVYCLIAKSVHMIRNGRCAIGPSRRR